MMEIATLLMACAVFAALAAVAVTSALKGNHVEDLIDEVFSPWIQAPFENSDAADNAETASRAPGERPGPRGHRPIHAKTLA